ncbi:MAG: metal-dependent hydrolase [Cytophagales bacterium]|nr:MAG: metal-dependent hydrolase [Cytophagales bacterium]TAF61241.1 MAG: metal-dependent hydrolase [Cytophagales bacterium]
MDSLTQIVLGAAVGEVVLGKKIGNKAMLWGALAGTIPDLDILASPFLDIVDEMRWHRSLTHSFLFAFLVSPALAYLNQKFFAGPNTRWREWTHLYLWGFITHALLDSFTTWGTQLFYPFSNYGVSFKSIFVVDPLYTLPFLACLIVVACLKRDHSKRPFWAWFGIGLSSFYLLLTVVNKFYINGVFEAEMARQGLTYSRYETKPTPLNNLLWNFTAESDSVYYSGYYSLLDSEPKIKFHAFKKQHDLLKPFWQEHKLQQLLEVTEGYYTVEKHPTGFVINDLRFGQTTGWEDGKGDFVFAYLMSTQQTPSAFTQRENDFKTGREMLGQFAERIFGK